MPVVPYTDKCLVHQHWSCTLPVSSAGTKFSATGQWDIVSPKPQVSLVPASVSASLPRKGASSNLLKGNLPLVLLSVSSELCGWFLKVIPSWTASWKPGAGETQKLPFSLILLELTDLVVMFHTRGIGVFWEVVRKSVKIKTSRPIENRCAHVCVVSSAAATYWAWMILLTRPGKDHLFKNV